MPGADEFTYMNFDPRSDHLRNDPVYYDYFRNVCLNFQGISNIFNSLNPLMHLLLHMTMIA